MSVPLSAKISPILRIATMESPVVPILVEGTPSTFYDLLSIFDTLHLNVYQSIPTFGMVAGMAAKEHIIDIAAQKEVLMVHPDQNNYCLSFPNPMQALGVDPFAIATNIAGQSLIKLNADFGKNVYDSFMQQGLNGLGALSNGLPALPPFPANLPPPPQLLPQGMPELPFAAGFGNLPQFPIQTPFASSAQDQNFGYSTAYTRKLLGLDKAEEVGLTGKGIKVCVIDTGVDKTSQQVSPATDFDDAMAVEPPIDENGHGTHTFTTAVGLGTINYRNIAVKGMAIDATPIAIKVLGGLIGTGRDSDVIKGMEMAYEKSAQVVSMSLGSNVDQPQSPSCRVVERLTQEGMIFVIAAGNSGSKPRTIGTPGTAESAITVGAVDPKDGQIASFSSRGLTVDGRIKPDICSYGVDIYSSTSRGSLLDPAGDNRIDGYAKLSGTSMATPHIAGFVAILKQAFKDASAKTIKQVFANKGIQKNPTYGWGVANWSWFESGLKK